MTGRQFPSKLTTLSAAILGALLAATASGQTLVSCDPGSGVVCTVSGSYSEQVMVQPTSTSPMPPMTVNASADITVDMQSNTAAALQIQSLGTAGYPGGNLNGGDTQGLTVTNTGNLTLQNSAGGPITVGSGLYGLYVNSRGGAGATTSDKENGGDGGGAGRTSDQIVSVTNSGNITMLLPGVHVPDGAAISAISEGGAGGTNTEGDGGTGGQSMGVALTNAGAINVTLAGTGRFSGLQAISEGGSGASGSNSLNGGGAGSVSIINSGVIALNWTWDSGASTNDASLFGVYAQALSGAGGDASADGNGGNAGLGAASLMSASATLQAGGHVYVSQVGAPPVAGAGVAAEITGGKGGDAPTDNDDVIGGNGGAAGQIQSGTPTTASARIEVNDANVTTSGDLLPALRVTTQGGAGGGNFSTGSYHDRNGGRGGLAGDASVAVNSTTAGLTLSTTGASAAGVDAVVQGGAGAAGGLYGGDILGVGDSNAGNGGVGGQAGQINISLKGQPSSPISVSTTGDNSAGISTQTVGGLGANGGELTGTIGGGAGVRGVAVAVQA